MTQNTQTTAERVAELILRSVEQSIIDFDHVFDADPVAQTIAAEIDALTAQLAEARSALAAMNADRCEILREFGALQGREAKAARELAEARAEVERLRLPAEAWRTLELYREAERNGTSEEAEAARWVHIPIRDAARARARAAKVTP